MKNTPYVKILDNHGICTNPITKENPFYNYFPNNKARRNLTLRGNKHPKNNKKGTRLIVTNIGKGIFLKTNIKKQIIGKKQITHYILRPKLGKQEKNED